jgi:hypothetical protein
LVERAIRKLAADLSYRTPAPHRPLCYAILERAQEEAVLLVLTEQRESNEINDKAKGLGKGRITDIQSVSRRVAQTFKSQAAARDEIAARARLPQILG